MIWEGNFYLKNYISEYFPVSVARQTASSSSQMSAKSNEAAEAQFQDGSKSTTLGGSNVLDPYSNLMKSQEQIGVCLSSQTFMPHHLATPR